MIGVNKLRPTDVAAAVIVHKGLRAVPNAEGKHNREAVAGRKAYRLIQRNGMIPGVFGVALLACHQCAGGRIPAGGILVDLDGIGHVFVIEADRNGIQSLVSVGLKHIGNLTVFSDPVVGKAAASVVLIAVVVAVQGDNFIECTQLILRCAVFIGQVKISFIAPGAAPGVADNPRTVAVRSVAAVKVCSGIIVIPANYGYSVVAVTGAVLNGTVCTGLGIEIRVAVIIAD